MPATCGELGGGAIRSDEAARPDEAPKYYLVQTTYRNVPITELQAMQVNAALP